MFIASFATGLWQANCYVVAAAGAGDCVVIDPGQDAAATVAQLLTEHRLTPRAVLATHGHFDHVADAASVAARYEVPVWIHPADRHLLSDPAAGLGPESAALVRQLLGAEPEEPAMVSSLAVPELELAGLRFSVRHCPGHTAGSVLLGLDHPGDPRVRRIEFTGDVLFAGSVGRTDLPGGDPDAMRATLSHLLAEIADDTVLLPGHGPQTTMATERHGNPYLQPAYLRN